MSNETVLGFFMSGCPHCELFEPIFREVGSLPELPHAFVVVQTPYEAPPGASELDQRQAEAELAMLLARYDIQGFPTVVALHARNGRVQLVDKHVGAMDSVEELQEWVKALPLPPPSRLNH